MNLIEILDVNLIDLELEASSKDEVIHQLCSLLYENGRVKDLEKFKEAVYEREQIGEQQVNTLNIKLSEVGRFDDIIKAAKDSTYQKKLFAEFGIV